MSQRSIRFLQQEPGARPNEEAQVVARASLMPVPDQYTPTADHTKPAEPASKFRRVLRDLLRGAPRRFKEIYPMVAECQPQDSPTVPCARVSISSLGWLREIQRDLQEIAVNQDGMWCLKEEMPPEFSAIQSTEKPSLEHGKTGIIPADPIQSAVKDEDIVARNAEHQRRSEGARRAWVKIRADRAAKVEAGARTEHPSQPERAAKASAEPRQGSPVDRTAPDVLAEGPYNNPAVQQDHAAAAEHERRAAGARRAWVKIRANRAAKAEAETAVQAARRSA